MWTGRTSKGLLAAGVATMLLCQSAYAAGEKPGRYQMSPAEGGGFVRLDTDTGQMSVCQRKDNDWACRDMNDAGRGLGSEIDRLREENQRLKAELRQLEDLTVGERRAEGRRKGDGLELKLPTEQEVDAALSYAQRMLKKFREKLKELESDSRPTPL